MPLKICQSSARARTHKRGHWANVRSWGANRTRRDGGNNIAEISECATWDDGAAILSIRDEDFAATCCVGPQLIREQLQAQPHKHSEKFRAVPSIASTIEHIGESRLGARDHSCIRPAIGTQTPWHDIRWLRLSWGTSEAFPVRISKRSPGGLFY